MPDHIIFGLLSELQIQDLIGETLTNLSRSMTDQYIFHTRHYKISNILIAEVIKDQESSQKRPQQSAVLFGKAKEPCFKHDTFAWFIGSLRKCDDRFIPHQADICRTYCPLLQNVQRTFCSLHSSSEPLKPLCRGRIAEIIQQIRTQSRGRDLISCYSNIRCRAMDTILLSVCIHMYLCCQQTISQWRPYLCRGSI